MNTQKAQIEKFFQFFVRPKKRNSWLSFLMRLYVNLTNSLTILTLLFVFVAIFVFGLILYSYDKNKSEINEAQELALETRLEKGDFAKQVSLLKKLISEKPKPWYRSFYITDLADKELINLVDKKLLEYTKRHCVPDMMRVLKSQLSKQLIQEEWHEVLESFRVYLMILGKETFNKNVVTAWFCSKRELLAQNLPIEQGEIDNLLASITYKMFESSAMDEYLYDKVITAIKSNAFSQGVYNSILGRLSSKPSLSISCFASKRLLEILDSAVSGLEVPYLYTKEGRAEFESLQKELISSLFKIQHLSEVVDLSRVKRFIRDSSFIYKESCNVAWQNIWTKIRFKKREDIELCLSDFKILIEEIPSIFSFVRRIESSVMTDGASFNKKVLIDRLEKGVELAKTLPGADKLNEKLQDSFSDVQSLMQENVSELIKCSAQIVNAKNKQHSCYNFVVGQSKESVINQGLVLASTLKEHLSPMYRDLIQHFNFILLKNSCAYVNAVWHKDLYAYYSKRIGAKYPFNAQKYQDQLLPEDFVSFFAPDGMLDQFKQKYLPGGKIGVTSKARAFLKYSDKIKKCWFGEDAQLKVAFNITNVTIDPGIKHLDLLMLGELKRISRESLGPHAFAWSEKGSESAKAEFFTNDKVVESLLYSGPWSWYKLLSLDSQSSLLSDGSLRKVLKSPKGELSFVLHFSSKFCPLDAKLLQIPASIVEVNSIN